MAYSLLFSKDRKDKILADIPEINGPFTLEVRTTIYWTEHQAFFKLFSLLESGTQEYLSIGIHEGEWKIVSNAKTAGSGGWAKFDKEMTLSMKWDGTEVHMIEDGNLIYSVVPSDKGFISRLDRLLIAAGANFDDRDKAHFELFEAKLYEGDELTHFWDPSASGGTGGLLPDTVSDYQASLFYFPDDDSQWVYYESEDDEEPTPVTPGVGIGLQVINAVVRAPVRTIIRQIKRGN